MAVKPKKATHISVSYFEELVRQVEGVRIVVRLPKAKKLKLADNGLYHQDKRPKAVRTPKGLEARLRPYLGDAEYEIVSMGAFVRPGQMPPREIDNREMS